MRQAPLFAAALAAALIPLRARADEAAKPFEWLPGAARAVPRTTSASRDAPVFEYAYGPRAQVSVGLEWGLFALRLRSASVRLGFHGMVALENEDTRIAFPAVELWRGLLGTSVSVSLESLARAWLGPDSKLEASLLAGHESDHRTGQGQEPSRPGDIPDGGGGDFVAPDLAVSLPAGRFFRVTARVQDRIFLRGALTNAPGADLSLRFVRWDIVRPTIALFGEEQLSRSALARNGFFARMLAGIALRGRLGEVTPFYSLDMGTGKGLLINRREVRSSLGVRYAPL